MRNLSRSAPLTGGGTIEGDLRIAGDLSVEEEVTLNVDHNTTGSITMKDKNDKISWQVTPKGQVGVGERAKATLQDKAGGANFLVEAKSIFELDGTCTVVGGNNTINASGASFKADLKVGSSVRLETATPQIVIVRQITSDNQFLTTVDTTPAGVSTELLIKLTMPPDRILEVANSAGVKGGWFDTAAQFHQSGTASPGVVYIENPQDDIEDEDVIGRIEFQAPEEDSGTDAILSGAAIWGVAEADFTSSNNSTGIVFGTNTSAAFTERMRINASGNVGIGDTDPSEAKLSITGVQASDIGLKIDHDIVDTHALSIDAENTTGRGLDIECDALTTGEIAKFYSNATTTDTRSLVNITNDHTSATGATCLFLDQDANQLSMKVASDATTTDGIELDVNSLTTGRGLLVYSSASNTSTRSLVKIVNDDASATGATGLYIQQDSTGPAMEIKGTSGIKLNSGTDEDHTVIDMTGVSAGGKLIWDDTAEGFKITKDTDGEFVSLILANESDAADTTGIVSQRFDLEDTGGTAVDSGKILVGKEASFTATASTQDSYMALHTSLNGTLAEKMRIDSAGNVGIGQSSPDGKLHIESGSAGTVATHAYADELIIENSGAAGISIRTPDANSGSIVWQSATNDTVARIYGSYNSGNELLAFETSGTERMIIDDNSRISLSNNDASGGASNTIFGYGTANALDNGSTHNVFIGHQVAGENTLDDAIQNTMVGYRAGHSLTSGDSNTLLGRQSGLEIEDGHNNTLIGMNAGSTTVLGGYLTVIGDSAMMSGAVAATADGSVAIGASALAALTSGEKNTAVGYQSLLVEDDGDFCTAVGYQALTAQTGTSGTVSNTAIGSRSSAAITTGIRNTSVGDRTLYTATTALNNVAIGSNSMQDVKAGQAIDGCVAVGFEALKGNSSNSTNIDGTIAIGKSAGAAITASTHSEENTLIGNAAGTTLTTGDGNVAIGAFALDAENQGHKTVAIGYSALSAQVSGADVDAYNTAVGYHSMLVATTAIENVAIGANSGINLETGDGNVIVGVGAGSGTEDVDKAVIIGCPAGQGVMTDAADGTVAIGYQALNALTTGDGNTAIGYQSQDANTTSGKNTSVGYSSLGAVSTSGSSTGNTAVGYDAGLGITTGLYNTCIGWQAGDTGNATGNTYVGQAAGSEGTGNYCVFVGMSAGDAGVNTQVGTVGVGYQSLQALTSGAGNLAIGYQAGKALTTSATNVAIGYQALDLATTQADNNIAIGYQSMHGNWTTADVNGCIAIGTTTLDGVLTSAASNTVAIGYNSLSSLTSGARNTALGYYTLNVNVAGDDNIAIGFGALAYGGAESADLDKNIAIGNYALDGADGAESNNMAIGYGAMGNLNHSNATRNIAIGNNAAIHMGTGLVHVDNIFIGYNAGGAEGASASWANNLSSYNVAIGNYAMDAAMDGALQNTAIGMDAMGTLTSGDYNTCVGAYCGNAITTGSNNVLIGNNTDGHTSSLGACTVIGANLNPDSHNQTVIGKQGIYRFKSHQYTCDHADGEDTASAASISDPLKLPAYSIIKSISVVVRQLSDIGTFNVALYLSTDTSGPADDTNLTASGLVEVLGAGASDTCSGNSASAVDIALGSGAVVKQSYYNGFAGAGLPVDSAAKYINVGNAGTGNGDSDPSTAGLIDVLVEYVGLD